MARYALFQQYLLHFLVNMVGAGLDGETGHTLEYRHLIQQLKYTNAWWHLSGNNIGQLTQGMLDRNEDTSTIFFIHKEAIPDNRWKAY